MNYYVSLSSDSNPNYLTLLPLAAESFIRLGWTPLVTLIGVEESRARSLYRTVDLPNKPGTPSYLAAALVRFFAPELHGLQEDDILTMSDADMVILQDIFPEFDQESFYSIRHSFHGDWYPMCYSAGSVKVWRKLFPETWNEFIFPDNYWCLDEKLLRDRVRSSGIKKVDLFRYKREDRLIECESRKLIDLHLHLGPSWNARLNLKDEPQTETYSPVWQKPNHLGRGVPIRKRNG